MKLALFETHNKGYDQDDALTNFHLFGKVLERAGFTAGKVIHEEPNGLDSGGDKQLYTSPLFRVPFKTDDYEDYDNVYINMNLSAYGGRASVGRGPWTTMYQIEYDLLNEVDHKTHATQGLNSAVTKTFENTWSKAFDDPSKFLVYLRKVLAIYETHVKNKFKVVTP
jgi:hypothetical protein